MTEKRFHEIMNTAKSYTYSSLEHVDYEDCVDADVLCEQDGLILLKEKASPLLHFAANDFRAVIEKAAALPGALRIHFVPQEYNAALKDMGFTDWAEYNDFWNEDIVSTAADCTVAGEADYLKKAECEEASAVFQKCVLQSRGFEGETPQWFESWLDENEVIVAHSQSELIGACCVAIINSGTTLWIRVIAVDPAHQGRGVGKKLMKQAIRYGVAHGATRGFLAADQLNKNAIGLYESLGFAARDDEGELQMVREVPQ
jgi:ribosomal protein S18 acetylase RimI-like enzyme